jgi:hypothetical protein
VDAASNIAGDVETRDAFGSVFLTDDRRIVVELAA